MRSVILLLLCFSITSQSFSQSPNWNLNTASYQYSMTFTCFLTHEGVSLISENDRVAAFVGNDVRGVASIVFIPSYQKYVAFLTVYANQNGETLNFKIFNSTNNTVVSVAKTETFVIDKNMGGVFQSYSIASPTLNNEAELISFGFYGVSIVSQTKSNNTIELVVPSGTDLSNLTPIFSSSSGASLYIENELQYSQQSSYDFSSGMAYTLVSEDQATLSNIQINVSHEINSTPTPSITLNSNSNEQINSGILSITANSNVAVSGFELEDIQTNNAVVYDFTITNSQTYSFTVTPIDQGELTVAIPSNTMVNDENESNNRSNTLSFTYDIERPYVVSILRKEPLQEKTNLSTLAFTILFSEEVQDVSVSDFESFAGATISLTKENSTTYSILITNIENYYGEIPLFVKETNGIKDKAGNVLLNSYKKSNSL
jgi:hypothetical protein